MPKTGQGSYIGKKKLVCKQNKGYNIKTRATQNVQDLHNQN